MQTAIAFSVLTVLPSSSPSFTLYPLFFSINPSLRLALFTFFRSSFLSPHLLITTRHYPLPVSLLSLALYLLLSPCVLPVAHDPAVQPQADCGAHAAGEAALGGALAQRTGASSSSSSSVSCLPARHFCVCSFPLISPFASLCLPPSLPKQFSPLPLPPLLPNVIILRLQLLFSSSSWSYLFFFCIVMCD